MPTFKRGNNYVKTRDTNDQYTEYLHVQYNGDNAKTWTFVDNSLHRYFLHKRTTQTDI